MLAEIIGYICRAREKFTEQLNRILSENKQTERTKVYQIHYRPSAELTDKKQEDILSFLMSKKQREYAAGYMLYGPHRDNFDFVSEGLSAKDIFSQGEYKNIYLELVFSANIYLRRECSVIPVILLDDVFSELDNYHSSKLTDIIGDIPNQIFITGVNRKPVPDGNYFLISNNTVSH